MDQTVQKVPQIIRFGSGDPGIRSPKGCGKITNEKMNLEGVENNFFISNLLEKVIF